MRAAWPIRITAGCMALWLGAASVPRPAAAALVATDSAAPYAAAVARTRVAAFLARDAVQGILKAQGIDPEEATQRAAGLSDAEAVEAARLLDRLPAGGSTVGIIVVASLLVFFVLLVTDLLGLTHIFPFVSRRR